MGDNSSFSQTHKVGNVGIIANFVFIYICSFLLYLVILTGLSKCKIRNQGEYKDYISRLYILLDLLIFNGTAKTKLAMLAFLYYGEFVKNSIIYNRIFHELYIL